jgi:hypothetical protein
MAWVEMVRTKIARGVPAQTRTFPVPLQTEHFRISNVPEFGSRPVPLQYEQLISSVFPLISRFTPFALLVLRARDISVGHF